MSRLAHPGLLKRQITGSLGNSPATMELAAANAIEAYTLPQGVLSQLCRDIAAGRPGLVTHVGLGSFVDPRNEGARQNNISTDNLVELIEINGREYLFYPSFTVDVAVIRATTADDAGNLTMEREPFIGDVLAMAQAAHNSGGIVIAQVERMRTSGTTSSRAVKVPGILVDAIVVDPDQQQTYAVKYSAGYSGEIRVPTFASSASGIDARLVVARRAALELFSGCIVNLGYGIATGIADLVSQEGVAEDLTLTVEQGIIGGIPAKGNDFGTAVNYDAMIEQSAQFDFYDGGGLDIAFLSFAEVDGRRKRECQPVQRPAERFGRLYPYRSEREEGLLSRHAYRRRTGGIDRGQWDKHQEGRLASTLRLKVGAAHLRQHWRAHPEAVRPLHHRACCARCG